MPFQMMSLLKDQSGRLIDDGLWDGKTPIRFEDVHAVAKKVKPLTDKDFSKFTLENFVQTEDSSQT